MAEADSASISSEQRDAVQQLLYREAQLLDARRFTEWLDLFTAQGYYWVSTSSHQSDPLHEPSLAYEDKLLMQIRIDRLNHEHAHSQRPPSRCHHLLQPAVLSPAPGAADAGAVLARSAFHYTEQRANQQIMIPGYATHTLLRTRDGWRIALKRIDLLSESAPLPMVQLFL